MGGLTALEFRILYLPPNYWDVVELVNTAVFEAAAIWFVGSRPTIPAKLGKLGERLNPSSWKGDGP